MKPAPSVEDMTSEAQETLDELFSARQIPFKLTAHKVESTRPGEYTVRFFDSRLHSVTIYWNVGLSFGDVVRTAVLARVARDVRPYQQSETQVA